MIFIPEKTRAASEKGSLLFKRYEKRFLFFSAVPVMQFLLCQQTSFSRYSYNKW